MEGDARRRYILELLFAAKHPLSGSEIAKKCGVSRK